MFGEMFDLLNRGLICAKSKHCNMQLWTMKVLRNIVIHNTLLIPFKHTGYSGYCVLSRLQRNFTCDNICKIREMQFMRKKKMCWAMWEERRRETESFPAKCKWQVSPSRNGWKSSLHCTHFVKKICSLKDSLTYKMKQTLLIISKIFVVFVAVYLILLWLNALYFNDCGVVMGLLHSMVSPL